MLIELYKDHDKLKSDFSLEYPNTKYEIIYLNNSTVLAVYSNDINEVNKINAEVFRFKGTIIHNTHFGNDIYCMSKYYIYYTLITT